MKPEFAIFVFVKSSDSWEIVFRDFDSKEDAAEELVQILSEEAEEPVERHNQYKIEKVG